MHCIGNESILGQILRETYAPLPLPWGECWNTFTAETVSFRCMRDLGKQSSSLSLSGSVLIAHPELSDPNFSKTVILVSVHEDDGSIGLVLNRPIDGTLGEHAEQFQTSPLGKLPVYIGGPVNHDELIICAWKWTEEGSVFRLYFGITPEKALELLATEPGLEMRAFLGYAGWGENQLEGEIDENAWVVGPVNPSIVQAHAEVELWKAFLTAVQPELGLLGDAPGDPSLN